MSTAAVGQQLRRWRERRHLSQLELAARADVSTRHVSFVENGRSRPTPAMILRLAEQLDVPLRDRNALLVAGGFAPAYPERPLTASSMAVVSDAVMAILEAHQPFPALVVDRQWDLVSANAAVYALLSGVAAPLLEPPVNVIRLTLHPDGLSTRIVNLPEWRAHLLDRLGREYASSADASLAALREEVAAYPTASAGRTDHGGGLVVPMRLRVGDDVLSMFSMTTVFGTPHEVTVSELAIETFYPADDDTARVLRTLGSAPGHP
jgi:transcriptional regulator with XRE-family HTH domain